MPKKNDQNKDKDKPGKGGGKKKGNNSYKDINNKAKKSKRKNVKINLPAIIAGKFKKENADHYENTDEPMSEYEMSYKDALLAVEMEKLAAKGLNNDQIIEALGISRFTFYKKLKDEPYFSYGLRKHRGTLVHEVQNALAQNALGFQYLEQQGTAMGDVVTVMKQKLPETKAQEVILYNMAGEQWKRKPEPAAKEADDISSIHIVIKRRG